jgi:hypothetical protein
MPAPCYASPVPLALRVLCALTLLLAGCGSSCGDKAGKRVSDDEDREARERETLDPDSTRTVRPLVYVISDEARLYSFDPRISGKSAYGLVGQLDCKSRGNPRSMGIDRKGTGWVFYDTGQLFRVDLLDASCESTPYRHPSRNTMLGMGFTSDAPGSSAETLHIMSPEFGLATLDLSRLTVSSTGKLRMSAELTGGGDARLFAFEADTGDLVEIDRATLGTKRIHTFADIRGARAWAFARFGGKFYVFSARGFARSRTTELDPVTKLARIRDDDVGFVIVGAGQSTIVDGTLLVTGDWPAEAENAPP